MLKIERLNDLTPKRKKEILSRSSPSLEEIMSITLDILATLRKEPEKEIFREYTPFKKNLSISDIKVSQYEIDLAFNTVHQDLIDALKRARDNIITFHKAQLERESWFTEISPGIMAGRLTRPLNCVGVYIPGGRASYPSSALMNIIPAKVAGVKTIVATSPPGPGFAISPEIVVAATLCDIDGIYKLGGAWAIGSMTWGLLNVPKVDKIVGPGSSWVTAAKLAVFGNVDIDLPAGPSEGFIISDGTNIPKHLAWDFLAQLEHDPQAAAVLITTSETEAEEVLSFVEKILPTLTRKNIIEESFSQAVILISDNLESSFNFANEYAPEHLQLAIQDSLSYLNLVENAGSVFLGPNTPIPAGDYATGTNHILPTGGTARAFSGLSTDSFLKKITFQKLSKNALSSLAPNIETIAAAEGMECHGTTIRVRL
jgi:histidinol dehydrogenase